MNMNMDIDVDTSASLPKLFYTSLTVAYWHTLPFILCTLIFLIPDESKQFTVAIIASCLVHTWVSSSESNSLSHCV